MTRGIFIGASLLLGGCATTQPEPVVITTKVYVPVTGACVPATMPAAPDYPDTRDALKAAKSADERYWLLSAGWPLRVARLNELEIVVAGCPKATK